MAERWRGAAGDRTRSPRRAKAKPVGRGAPTNPSPAGTRLFQPPVALGFLPGQEGGPRSSPQALTCIAEGRILSGQDLATAWKLEGRARAGSGWRWSKTRKQATWCKTLFCPKLLHSLETILCPFGLSVPTWGVVLGVDSRGLQSQGAELSRKGHLATRALPLSSGGDSRASAQTRTPVLTPCRNDNNKNPC